MYKRTDRKEDRSSNCFLRALLKELCVCVYLCERMLEKYSVLYFHELESEQLSAWRCVCELRVCEKEWECVARGTGWHGENTCRGALKNILAKILRTIPPTKGVTGPEAKFSYSLNSKESHLFKRNYWSQKNLKPLGDMPDSEPEPTRSYKAEKICEVCHLSV